MFKKIDVPIITYLEQACNMVRRFGYVSGRSAVLQGDVSTRDRVNVLLTPPGRRNNAEIPTPEDIRKAHEVLDWALHLTEDDLASTHHSAVNTLARVGDVKWHTSGLAASMVKAFEIWKKKQETPETPRKNSA